MATLGRLNAVEIGSLQIGQTCSVAHQYCSGGTKLSTGVWIEKKASVLLSWGNLVMA